MLILRHEIGIDGGNGSGVVGAGGGCRDSSSESVCAAGDALDAGGEGIRCESESGGSSGRQCEIGPRDDANRAKYETGGSVFLFGGDVSRVFENDRSVKKKWFVEASGQGSGKVCELGQEGRGGRFWKMECKWSRSGKAFY